MDLNNLSLYRNFKSSYIRMLIPKPIRSIGGRMINRILDTRYGQYFGQYIFWKGYITEWERMWQQDQLRESRFGLPQEKLHIDYDDYGKRKSGWHNYGSFWWLDPRCPFSFSYASLDQVYPESYFDREYHPQVTQASELYEWMQQEYRKLVGHPFFSVLELGSGAGYISKTFKDHNIDFCTVEGTSSGCKKLFDMGVPVGRIVHADLRTWHGLGRKFDLVMCTEVAEHIEMPFIGHVIEQACQHADFVWFSSPAPGPSDGPKHLAQNGDYEHCSCLPLTFWDNLFSFFGFSAFVRLNAFDCTKRGMRLYYSAHQK